MIIYTLQTPRANILKHACLFTCIPLITYFWRGIMLSLLAVRIWGAYNAGQKIRVDICHCKALHKLWKLIERDL